MVVRRVVVVGVARLSRSRRGCRQAQQRLSDPGLIRSTWRATASDRATGTPSSSTRAARSSAFARSSCCSRSGSIGPWRATSAGTSARPSAVASGTGTVTVAPHGTAAPRAQPHEPPPPVHSPSGRPVRPSSRSTAASSRRLPAGRSSSEPKGSAPAVMRDRHASASGAVSPDSRTSTRPSSRRWSRTLPSLSAPRRRSMAAALSTSMIHFRICSVSRAGGRCTPRSASAMSRARTRVQTASRTAGSTGSSDRATAADCSTVITASSSSANASGSSTRSWDAVSCVVARVCEHCQTSASCAGVARDMPAASYSRCSSSASRRASAWAAWRPCSRRDRRDSTASTAPMSRVLRSTDCLAAMDRT